MLPISVATARHPWEVGPQMNKFEQVSSDHHQMSLLGDKSPGVNGGVPLPCDLSHDAFDVTYPYEQTDACENITFSQLYLGESVSKCSANI